MRERYKNEKAILLIEGGGTWWVVATHPQMAGFSLNCWGETHNTTEEKAIEQFVEKYGEGEYIPLPGLLMPERYKKAECSSYEEEEEHYF